MENDRKKVIYKVTLVGTLVNVLLSAGKLVAGIVGRSGAMVADAMHSLSDFVTDIIVLLFVRLSLRPTDEDHKYGHGKYETFASVIISAVLILVGIGIGYENIKTIWEATQGAAIPEPRMIALVAAFVSIVSKELLYWYTVRAGKQINSSTLIANGWHHRSDALSSIAALLGIAGAMFLGEKYRILDPITAVFVSLLIIKVGYGLLKPNMDELLEKSLPKKMEDEIYEVIKNCDNVQDPHNLKTRRIGTIIAIESHIRADSKLSFEQSHAIATNVEQKLKEVYGEDTLVIIHMEPISGPCRSKK